MQQANEGRHTGWQHTVRVTVKRTLNMVLPSGLFLCHGPSGSRSIALTFDDGPDTVLTPKIGQILRGFGLRATFFVSGERVTQDTEGILQRLVADGHEVACHRFTHRHVRDLSLAEFRRELEHWKERCGMYCRAVRRGDRIPFRPPFGEVTIRTLLSAWGCGYGVVLWSLESEDWKGLSVEELAERVRPDAVRNGEIIVFHDTCSQTPEALEVILPRLKNAGFGFVTISEMIRGRGE